MSGPFVDFKGLVSWMILVRNMEGCSTAHLFSAVQSRGISGLL